MFMFRASRYLEELEKFAPEMLACCRAALDKAQRDLDFVRLDAEAFAACPKDSIDYAVMEKTADAVLVAPRERAQDVKAIVEQLKAQGRGEAW